MAPKTVNCSICGETVLKSQTVSIDNSTNPPRRACRHHEEAQSQAEILKQKEKDRISKMTAPKPKRKSWTEHHHEEMTQLHNDIEKGVKRCWCCGESGIFIHEYYSELWLLSVTAPEGMHMFSPKWPEYVKKYFNIKYECDIRAIHMVKSLDIKNIKGLGKYRDHRKMIEYSPICISCLKIHKHEHLIPENKITGEQLRNFSVVSEMAAEGVRKEFKEFCEKLEIQQ